MAVRIVLTGRPGSGLSTLTRMLGEVVGAPTIKEIAREIITEGKFHPDPKLGGNPVAFRREALKRQLSAESRFDDSNLVVYQDRGAYDGIGYCYAYGSEVPDFLRSVPGPRYSLAFLLEPLPRAVLTESDFRDGVRYEDMDDPAVLSLQTCLSRAYEENGVKVVHVPFDTEMKRLRLILEAVSRHLEKIGWCKGASYLDDYLAASAAGHPAVNVPSRLRLQTA